VSVRVLIVDDDAAFRAAIGAVLTERGYEVVGEAATVAHARVAMSQLRPDALVLDVNLPDGNGIVFATELRTNGDAARVVLTSTDSAAATPRLLERSGAAGFIVKTELIVADLRPYLG
jgi:DNA-binding NarL/FixJ family response regulator